VSLISSGWRGASCAGAQSSRNPAEIRQLVDTRDREIAPVRFPFPIAPRYDRSSAVMIYY
jgi:hypothetical protein